MLFDPSSHEPLTDRPWDDSRVRNAIATVVADAESAFDEHSLWPAHPLDEDGEALPPVASLYLGASGVIWALARLERVGVVDLRRDWASVAVSLVERYHAQPDFQDYVDGPVPSLWMGAAGILLVAHTVAPATWQEEQLFDAVRANATNPSLELMWGSPGTMIAAQLLHERTGADRWLEAWRTSAEQLLAQWHDDLWVQDLYGSRVRILGPAHGFAGNVLALTRGDLLDSARRTELEHRVISTAAKYVCRADGLAQWPPALEPPGKPQAIRTQWCHGAPGIVASLALLAPSDDQLTELLVAGGELTWQAGPLRKGANLCHGTAGNGYAFLKLFERTGDELWLDRARGFAMHTIEQMDQARVEHGRGRHTLWTGDPGTALYLHSCLSAQAAVPTLDHF